MAGPLKSYEVKVGDNLTTMKLTEAEARRLGVSETKKRTAANKAMPAPQPRAPEHVCDACGFEAKSAAGLTAHGRSHED